MNKSITLLLFLAMATFSCKKNNSTKPPVDIPTPDTAALISVKLLSSTNAGILTADINCTINGDVISALIPPIENDKKLVVTFTTQATGSTVTINDTVQVSGTTKTNFYKPVTYLVTTPKGVKKTYTFTVKNFTGIPILYLNTAGGAPIVSKEDYLDATLVVNTNSEFEQEKTTITTQVKGRGNSTWGLHPKKPYRMKFSNKAPMLGLPTAKNWVLLANYSDKTLLRTGLAFHLGQKLDADFTPKGRFVELVLNGEHLGSYYLTYQVEVNENRVNIPELKAGDTSADKITGGYLLELDERLDEDFWFRTKKNVPFTIKSPEDIPQVQLDYIKKYMQDTEDAIFAADYADPVTGYAKYINVDSFINWYIVQELFKNEDAKKFSSVYFYKNRGEKLSMGPLWDFDLAIGNVNYSVSRNATGWWIKDGPWFSGLFKDPAFRAKVKARWNQVRGNELQTINPYIDSTAAYINLSQQKNFTKWPILNMYVWPNPIWLGTYDKEVAQVKKWLNERSLWLNTEINKW
ncbi:MAG: hypothetical protein EOP47_14065 [Sphingobacteriaceae bacterium]|nr:MAG: hypothetical protein EOP47_14065 [Sphingobacteriaceae bacterium]